MTEEAIRRCLNYGARHSDSPLMRADHEAALSALDALQAELATAREREQQWPLYAHHIPGCSYKGGTGECDCGLRELERALDATGGQE